MSADLRPPSGHVFRVNRSHGPVWYAEYRLPDGRQVQRKFGPACTERGRPAAGYFTKRSAEAWLARGGLGARPSARLGTRRGPIPDGGVHGLANGRTARAAMARRRLRRQRGSCSRQLLRRPSDDPEVRQGSSGAAGAGCRHFAGAVRPPRRSDRPCRPREVVDPDGRRVELTVERWDHIVDDHDGHPELNAHIADMMLAVSEPHERRPGRRDNELWYFRRDVGPSRWL